MTAKQFLERAERSERKIKLLTDQMQMAKSTAYVKAMNYESTGASHSSNADDGIIPKAVASVDEYRKKLDKQLKEHKKIVAEIESILAEIVNPKVYETMKRKYLMYQPIEGTYSDITGEYTVGICDSMYKSRRQVYRILDEGLEEVKLILKGSQK